MVHRGGCCTIGRPPQVASHSDSAPIQHGSGSEGDAPLSFLFFLILFDLVSEGATCEVDTHFFPPQARSLDDDDDWW